MWKSKDRVYSLKLMFSSTNIQYLADPIALIIEIPSSPTGPHPITKTSSPATSNLSTPLWATPIGSNKTASSGAEVEVKNMSVIKYIDTGN